jgi:hypothetical protein
MNCTKEEADKLVEQYWEREWERVKAEKELPSQKEKPITLEQCKNEFKNLKTYTTQKPNSRTSSNIIPYYHKSLVEANKKDSDSPVTMWKKLQTDPELFKKFLKNRYMRSDYFKESEEKNKMLWRGEVPMFIYVIGMNSMYLANRVSYFKPKLGKYIIDKYLSEEKEIFDPFSGSSGRLLATCACEKYYIGQDLNAKHIQESQKIIDELNLNAKVKVQDIFKDMELNRPALFTCSPYRLTEQWNFDSDGKCLDKDLSCDEWIDVCIEKYKCPKMVFVTDDTLVKYKKYEVETIINSSHFGKNLEKIVMMIF